MIKYKRNIIDMMAEKGITTYLIRKNKIFIFSNSQFIKTLKTKNQKSSWGRRGKIKQFIFFGK